MLGVHSGDPNAIRAPRKVENQAVFNPLGVRPIEQMYATRPAMRGNCGVSFSPDMHATKRQAAPPGYMELPIAQAPQFHGQARVKFRTNINT